MRHQFPLYAALLVLGILALGTGLVVALGYIEQPGPFNEGLLGAIGGSMTGAGFRGLRKCRSSISGTGRLGTTASADQ
jgi:hypothetical protein